MGFGSSNYKNSQSEDPYALEIDDDDCLTKPKRKHKSVICLTRPKRKHKSVIKHTKFFKNCSSRLSVDICRPQERHLCGSPWHLSEDFSPQTNRREIQVSEKRYRFFKSRNTFLLSGENLKSGISPKCATQEYGNVEYSSEAHYLADTENEENEKSFTVQDIASFPSNSFIKQSMTNSLTATKATASPQEEKIFSSMPRILPRTGLEKAVPALSEDQSLNLRSIEKFHNQNSSRIGTSFMFQKCKNILHKQQKETLSKSYKFFKSRNGNAFSKCNHEGNCCSHRDKESLHIENYIPGNVFPTNIEPISKDPYSLEAEDDSYSNTQNEEFKYVNTENMCIYQDENRPSTEKCSLSSKSQSNYPNSFEMKGDLPTTVNKNFTCMGKQEGFKSSTDQFLTEVEHYGCMQSADATKTKMYSPGKKNIVSSNNAVNQPSVDNIINQSKKENYFPVVNTRINNTFQPTNESDEHLSLPRSGETGLNLCDKRRHQVEINHLPSSKYAGENGKSQSTATSSKKCSIAYTYVIKNALSVVTQKRNSPKDTNTESIHEENKHTYDTHLTSGNINCKKENISNKESCNLTHETKSKISPVMKSLAKLKIHSNLTEKKRTRAINVTDNNEKVMSSSYTVCNKTAIVKPSLRTKEFCTPEINSTYMDVNNPKSPKQKAQSSCISFAKSTDIDINLSGNVQNHLIRDQLVSESTTDETENHFNKKAEDFQLSCSSQRKNTQEMLKNVFTDGTEITKSCQHTTTSSHEKQKMDYHMKTKDNTNRENLIKLQANTIPTNIKTTEKGSGSETECSAKQAISTINGKTCLPIKKRGSSFKKRIFTSNQIKKSGLLYRHKWVDDTDGNKDTKLMSPTGLLVQPVAIISSGHVELEELRSPLLCVTSKHIQTKAEVGNNEIDKKYITVIKNVRNSDQIQELGELQGFNDDVEYILDALQDCKPITTRCHSALKLASKCLMPEFRKHAEAYDTMTKFSCALHDAAEDESLALCAATVMFVLSQYQIIKYYMSSSSIHLLLSLFNSRFKYEAESVQLQSIKKKVLELCAGVQSQGFVKHLRDENITANHLASEVLLRLISCDTGYLFEDRLRKMGGLKHIITAIINCSTEVDGFFIQWREDLIDKLRFLNCCLQILEYITVQNEESQLYILKYESSCFMGIMAALLSKCTGEIRNDHHFHGTAGVVTLEVLFTILKVLINLTYSNNDTSFGSSLVARRPEIIHASLYALLQVPNYVPEEKKFDLLALVLMFLINAVEHETCNRRLIFEAKASDIMVHNSNNKRTVKALIELFYQQEKLARIEEFKTNAMLDDQIESELSPEPLEPSQEFIATLQEKAGQNMEYTMIASYIVLLIGYLIVDNEEYEIYVRQCLPQRSFSTMISVLEKMHNFFNMVPAISSKKDITQIQHIIQCLKKADENAIVGTSNTYQL